MLQCWSVAGSSSSPRARSAAAGNWQVGRGRLGRADPAKDGQVGSTGGMASTARQMGSPPPGSRQASRKGSFPHPGAGLHLHWGTCLGFSHLLPQISMLTLLSTPQSWDSRVSNDQSGNGVLFCSESIFLHSVSTLGHACLMLTFSPYPGIWLFYETAHSHLFNLKSIRQRLNSM